MDTRLQQVVYATLLLALLSMATMAQERQPDHDELRAMLKTGTEALNSKNLDVLAPLLHEKFSITTVDQKLFTNLGAFKAYYATLFGGERAPLKSLTFNPTADELTVFVGDNIGLSHGTSSDTYVFSDGDTRTMSSRWTATVFKENGKWKILNLHLGTDPLANPVVTALKSYLYKIGLGAGLVGLVVGFVLGRLGRRR
jgi:hypothetical protein